MAVILFTALLLAGIACLVGGLMLTRLTWRADVAPFGRRSRAFQIALHPERYARPERLRAIRGLKLLGAALLCGALAVVGYDIVATVAGR